MIDIIFYCQKKTSDLIIEKLTTLDLDLESDTLSDSLSAVLLLLSASIELYEAEFYPFFGRADCSL